MPYYGYGAFDFNTVMQQWVGIGLFDLILPIILIFTIIFAILQRTRILGGIKGIDSIVALVIGFFAIINPEITAFFIPFFSNLALGIIIIIAFLLIAGLIMPQAEEGQWNTITLFGGVAIFFWVMSRAATYFSGYGLIFSTEWWLNNSWWVVPAILFGLMMAFVVNSSNNQPDQKSFKAWKTLYNPTG